MPDSFERILLLILGWLFGLLSPAIIDSIARKREIGAIRQSIINELDEVSYQVLGAIFLIDLRFNSFDKDNIKWQLSLFQANKDRLKAGTAIKFLDLALQLDGDALKAFVADHANDQGKGLALKKYHAPLLNASFPKFQHLTNETQTRLLEINNRIHILNQLVEEYQFFFQESFRENNFGSSYENVLGNINKALDAFRTQGVIFIENTLSLKVAIEKA